MDHTDMDFSCFDNLKVCIPSKYVLTYIQKVLTYRNMKQTKIISPSAARINIFQKISGKIVDWEPLRLQWEQDNSITNWNYQAFIFEYNLQLFASNWHLTQHFEPRG